LLPDLVLALMMRRLIRQTLRRNSGWSLEFSDDQVGLMTMIQHRVAVVGPSAGSPVRRS